MADYGKIERLMDRRAEALDRAMDQASNRVPLEDTGRMFYSTEVHYESDTLLQVRVIKTFDWLNGWFGNKGFINQFGPFVIMKVEDVLAGDEQARIDIGAVIVGKWNKSRKSYYPYLYKAEPSIHDPELIKVADFLKLPIEEVVYAKV